MLDSRKRNMILVGMVVNILIFLLIIKNYGTRVQYVEDLIVYMYAYFDFQNLQALVSIVIIIINPLIIILAVGEEIQKNLKVFGPYIFTRGKSRSRFFLEKVLKIIGYALIYIVFQVSTTVMVGVLFGIDVKSISTVFELIVYIVVMNLSSIFVMVVLANVMNLIIEFKYVLLMILSYQIGMFSLFRYVNLIDSKIIQYMPSTNRIFGWYDNNLIGESFREIFIIKSESLLVRTSLIINVVMIVIVIFIGIRVINKKNIV